MSPYWNIFPTVISNTPSRFPQSFSIPKASASRVCSLSIHQEAGLIPALLTLHRLFQAPVFFSCCSLNTWILQVVWLSACMSPWGFPFPGKPCRSLARTWWNWNLCLSFYGAPPLAGSWSTLSVLINCLWLSLPSSVEVVSVALGEGGCGKSFYVSMRQWSSRPRCSNLLRTDWWWVRGAWQHWIWAAFAATLDP